MRPLIIIVALFASFPALAQVNKCMIDGKLVYQAAPCKAGSEKAVIKPRNDVTEDAAKVNREKFLSDDGVRQTKNRKEQIDREINALDRDIDGYQKSMDSELSALKVTKSYANNNLAGATWEQSLATEMQSVTAKYHTKIQAAQERIKNLRQEKDRLEK